MSEDAQQKLKELLARLNSRADESLPHLRLTGRAISRSDKSIHVQTSSGLVVIPISEIVDVNPSDADPLIVSVEVKSPEAVQYVAPNALAVSPGNVGFLQSGMPVRPLVSGTIPFSRNRMGGFGVAGGITRLPEMVVGTLGLSLTSTVTAGEFEADATDVDDSYFND